MVRRGTALPFVSEEEDAPPLGVDRVLLSLSCFMRSFYLKFLSNLPPLMFYSALYLLTYY